MSVNQNWLPKMANDEAATATTSDIFFDANVNAGRLTGSRFGISVSGRGTGEPSEDGRAGKASERRRREQGCVDGKNVTPPHGNGGRWVDGKKALHNPAHRYAAGNRRFCLPYAFGNAGDRCGDVQRVLNAYFAGVDTAFVHYLRTFETEKRIHRWRRDRLCGHFDGRGGMTSPQARRRFACLSLSHYRSSSLIFVRPQRHHTSYTKEVKQSTIVVQLFVYD